MATEPGHEPSREAKNLRVMRENEKLTQQQLADKLDMDVTWLSKLETGSETINGDTAIALSRLFNAPLNLFYATDGPRRRRRARRNRE